MTCCKHAPAVVTQQKTEDNYDNECPVCFEAVNSDKEFVLACKHKFHKECIKNWADTNKNTCPMCRAVIDNKTIRSITNARAPRRRRAVNPIVNQENQGADTMRFWAAYLKELFMLFVFGQHY